LHGGNDAFQSPCHSIGALHGAVLAILPHQDLKIPGQSRMQFTRGGPLSPAMVVSVLLFQVVKGERLGYGRMLESFWGEGASLGLELPQERPVTAQAFCAARRKLPADLVRSLVREAADRFDRTNGDRFLWRGRRLLAVDGQRRFVQASDELLRFGRPEGAHYPMVHVTTLFDVVSKVPHDVEVGRYGTDERRQLLVVLERARKGDVLVLDAGYPSFDVLAALRLTAVDFVVRLPVSNTFKAVEAFLADGRTEGVVLIEPTADCTTRDMEPLAVRIVVVRRGDGAPWVLATSLSAADFPAAAIAEAYALRWQIEESHKLLAGDYLGQGRFHARTAEGVRQEVYAQALFVVITRTLMAAASAAADAPFERLSQKAAVVAVGEHITRLVLRQPPQRAHASLSRLLTRIAAARDRARPSRSVPRRSFLPARKWGPNGRRAGG
jgi:hypothetical protein